MTARIQFEFWIEERDDGSVESSLKLATPEDLKALRALPSGGLTQVPYALLLETLRREAYTMGVAMLSSGVSPEGLNEERLDDHVRAHILKMLDLHSRAACAGALSQLRGMG